MLQRTQVAQLAAVDRGKLAIDAYSRLVSDVQEKLGIPPRRGRFEGSPHNGDPGTGQNRGGAPGASAPDLYLAVAHQKLGEILPGRPSGRCAAPARIGPAFWGKTWPPRIVQPRRRRMPARRLPRARRADFEGMNSPVRPRSFPVPPWSRPKRSWPPSRHDAGRDSRLWPRPTSGWVGPSMPPETWPKPRNVSGRCRNWPKRGVARRADECPGQGYAGIELPAPGSYPTEQQGVRRSRSRVSASDRDRPSSSGWPSQRTSSTRPIWPSADRFRHPSYRSCTNTRRARTRGSSSRCACYRELAEADPEDRKPRSGLSTHTTTWDGWSGMRNTSARAEEVFRQALDRLQRLDREGKLEDGQPSKLPT